MMLTSEDVSALLSAEVAKVGTALAWANKAKVSATYVSDVIRGRAEPGAKILAALGLERVTFYRKVAK